MNTPNDPLIRVVAAVIFNDAGHLLICRRPAHKRHGGLWEFPGGKIEPGETDLDAAARELHEELAVHVLSVLPTTFSVHDAGSPFMIEFMPTTIQGIPAAIEHSELAWVPPSGLLQYDLAPSDRLFATHLVTQASVTS
jgi:mutator protein MutT